MSADEAEVLKEHVGNFERFTELTQLYNDRALFPDDEAPRPLEIRYRGRSRRVRTVFGEVTLTRSYYYHPPSGQGRCPLDEQLQLEGSCTPSVARLMCRAASQSLSNEEAAADLKAYAQLVFDPRDLGRQVAALGPPARSSGLSGAHASPAWHCDFHPRSLREQ